MSDYSQNIHSSVMISRRNALASLIILPVAAPFVSACASRSMSDCDGIASPLDKSVCLQEYYVESTAERMTVAAIIGAGLGAAVVIGTGGNPIAGAVVGALLASAVAGAERYIQLRLEENKHDAIKAAQAVVGDVAYDNNWSQQSAAHMAQALQTYKQALNSKTGLEANLKLVGKSRKVQQAVTKTEQKFYKGLGIYEQVPQTHIKNDAPALETINFLRNSEQMRLNLVGLRRNVQNIRATSTDFMQVTMGFIRSQGY